MSEKKPYSPVVQWRETGSGTAYQEIKMSSPRKDPTADAALGNIMREERRKRKKEKRREERRQRSQELQQQWEAQGHTGPYRRKKNPYHTRVWRAEDDEPKAADLAAAPNASNASNAVSKADPTTPTAVTTVASAAAKVPAATKGGGAR